MNTFGAFNEMPSDEAAESCGMQNGVLLCSQRTETERKTLERVNSKRQCPGVKQLSPYQVGNLPMCTMPMVGLGIES